MKPRPLKLNPELEVKEICVRSYEKRLFIGLIGNKVTVVSMHCNHFFLEKIFITQFSTENSIQLRTQD